MSIESEASIIGATEKSPSTGVTEKVLWRSGIVRVEPHCFSGSDCKKQVRLQQNKA